MTWRACRPKWPILLYHELSQVVNPLLLLWTETNLGIFLHVAGIIEDGIFDFVVNFACSRRVVCLRFRQLLTVESEFQRETSRHMFPRRVGTRPKLLIATLKIRCVLQTIQRNIMFLWQKMSQADLGKFASVHDVITQRRCCYCFRLPRCFPKCGWRYGILPSIAKVYCSTKLATSFCNPEIPLEREEINEWERMHVA